MDQRSPSMDLLHPSPSPPTGLNITDYNYDLTATARSGRLPKQSPLTTPFQITAGANLDSSESLNRAAEREESSSSEGRPVPVFSYKLR